VAREQQVTDAEISAIQGIVRAVSAGRIDALMKELSRPDRD